jgi:hypothetical protein
MEARKMGVKELVRDLALHAAVEVVSKGEVLPVAIIPAYPFLAMFSLESAGQSEVFAVARKAGIVAYVFKATVKLKDESDTEAVVALAYTPSERVGFLVPLQKDETGYTADIENAGWGFTEEPELDPWNAERAQLN